MSSIWVINSISLLPYITGRPKMTYEELTAQTKITIADFIDRSKSADSVHSAELFFNAAWGGISLWRDLANNMRQDTSEQEGKLALWNAIIQQDEIFSKLVDRQSIPLLKSRS